VVSGEKYLGANGGEALCAAIRRAIATQAPGARYKAAIKALSPTRLAAIMVVNGQTMPEHKFAIMDDELSPEAMQRFARSLAADVAKAVKK
jgi:hypothetical protein